MFSFSMLPLVIFVSFISGQEQLPQHWHQDLHNFSPCYHQMVTAPSITEEA